MFQHTTGSFATGPLPCLFEWLVRILGSRKSAQLKGTAAAIGPLEKYFPKATIHELLHKCLMACSSHGNKQLMTSTLVLAHMLGNKLVNDELEKLLSVNMSDLDISEAVPSETNLEAFFSREKESVHPAAKMLELIKLRRKKITEPTDDHVAIKTRWTKAESWNSCPIGMLPHTLGSSGCLPVLDCNSDNLEMSKLSNSKIQLELNPRSGNRAALCAVEKSDDLNMKNMNETDEDCEAQDEENTSDGIERAYADRWGVEESNGRRSACHCIRHKNSGLVTSFC